MQCGVAGSKKIVYQKIIIIKFINAVYNIYVYMKQFVVNNQ